MTRTSLPAARLAADARNRLVRSAIGGLVVAVAVDVSRVVVDALDGTDPVHLRELALAAARTAGYAVFAWVLRRYGDPSGVPTPLPPEDPGPPAADVGAPDTTLAGSAPGDVLADHVATYHRRADGPPTGG